MAWARHAMCESAFTVPYLTNLTQRFTLFKYSFINQYRQEVIQVAVRPREWVCGSSLDGIAGSNPAGAGGMDVCHLRMLYIVR
jgi:hypothetical protein